MNQKDLDIIKKYLKGIASTDEKNQVEKLLSSKDDLPQLKEFIKDDWDDYFNSEPYVGKDLSHVLDRVHHIIQIKGNKERRIKKYYRWYSSIAAILLIPLITFEIISFFRHDNINTIHEKESVAKIFSPSGGRLNFQLPDGTKGVLNSGSSIEYHVPFRDKRNVKLIGEAYFEVKHDEKYPFTVHTQKCNVKVYGTRFNVSAYPEDTFTEVVLEKGKVACQLPGKDEDMFLKPNDRIVVAGDSAVKSTVDAANYTAWRDGKLIFHGDLMKEVIRRISRWYNVDIQIADEELYTYSFRATFVDESLEEVLNLIKMSSHINYKVIPRKKLANDNFSRKKVILYKGN